MSPPTTPPRRGQALPLSPDPLMGFLMRFTRPDAVTELQKSLGSLSTDARELLSMTAAIRDMTLAIRETNQSIKDLTKALR